MKNQVIVETPRGVFKRLEELTREELLVVGRRAVEEALAIRERLANLDSLIGEIGETLGVKRPESQTQTPEKQSIGFKRNNDNLN